MNIFNDTTVGTIPFNEWTDGSAQSSGITRVSVCEGLATNKAACIGGDTTYNKTLTVNSSFSPQNMTSDSFWPNNAASGVTENTYPPNQRRALGSIQDNTFDIWNVLEKISNAINSLNPSVLIPDYVPRNSTNSGAPTSYVFP
jgi:hypothetical protein